MDRASVGGDYPWDGHIRPITVDDLDFMYEVASACYPAFDKTEAWAWAQSVLTQPNIIALKSGQGFVVASITRLFYRKDSQCFIVFICAKPNRRLEGYRLLKSVVQSARERGASKIFIGSDTGFDFAPFATRLGWDTQPPTYALSL